MAAAEIPAAKLFGPFVSAPVNGAKVLSEISDFYRRFIVISPSQADLLALWTAHTWCAEVSDFTPYINITSATPRCGKSRVGDVAELLVRNPLKVEGLTKAALVRITAEGKNTLLMDEMDQQLKADKELSAAITQILNSGFKRDGKVTLCEPAKKGTWTNREFSTFGPKMLLGIGKLPATVRDRSLVISMVRKTRFENVERFRLRKVKNEVAELRSELMLWCAENQSRLLDNDPDLPEQLNDRQQDVCEPLISIADLAGGDWPARGRKAIVEICTGDTADEDSLDTQLLSDIKNIFEGSDRLPSAELVARLLEIEASPWSECNRGKPLNAAWLARRLKAFKVQSQTIRLRTGSILKGYCRASFVDPWERYLTTHVVDSADADVTPLQPASLDVEVPARDLPRNSLIRLAESASRSPFTHLVTPVTDSKREERKSQGCEPQDYLFKAAVSLCRSSGKMSAEELISALMITPAEAIQFINEMRKMGVTNTIQRLGPEASEKP